MIEEGRCTDRFKKVLKMAKEEAARLGEDYASTEHILLGILGIGESTATRALETIGITEDQIREKMMIQIAKKEPLGKKIKVELSPRARRVLTLVEDEARVLNNNYFGTEHLLLALVREADGLAGRVLCKLGAELEKVRLEVIKIQDGGEIISGREKPEPKS